MADNIYDYLKENFGIEVKDYTFKRDYIKEPLKKEKHNRYWYYEKPCTNDVHYMYIKLNISRFDIGKLLNVSQSYLKKILRNNNIIKNIKDISKNRILSNKRKYGVVNYSQLDIWKDKIIANNIKKYGVKWYFQTSKYKNTMKSKINNIVKKVIITKRKNHTFNVSKEENNIYNLLLCKFSTVLRQYKSKLYPYLCDFYIPEIDTYIEYNGHWSHGFEPYIGTKNQLEKIYKWKSSNKKYYINAIKTWTIRDPLKRETAKKNNLNYLD